MKIHTDTWLESIADSLATHGFAIEDNFLSLREVREIKTVFEIHKDQDRFKKAGIGKADEHQLNKTIRGDYIKWIDPNHAFAPVQGYLSKINDLIEYLNKTCYLGIQDYESHFTIYPSGSFYKRHLDQFRDTGNRKISFICYLNEDWQPAYGGQLRMYLPKGHKDVMPLAGRLACFVSSEIEHEVIKCTQPRYSITGWMLNQKKTLDFLP